MITRASKASRCVEVNHLQRYHGRRPLRRGDAIRILVIRRREDKIVWLDVAMNVLLAVQVKYLRASTL